MNKDLKIGIVGLGYVGLPLCVEFAKHFNYVVGYDINQERVDELHNHIDRTGEVSRELVQFIQLTTIF